MDSTISSTRRYAKKRIPVLDTDIAYVDEGSGTPVVFLHGNPTSSYLWRNIIPHVSDGRRCLAPDLAGMGDSGPAPDGNYHFQHHAQYLEAWLNGILPEDRIVFVVHDWGSALGFDWSSRHPERVRGIAYMEAIVRPLTWDDWPEAARSIFQGMRSPAGESLVLEKNVFVERILPASVMRKLSDAEMTEYRRPYLAAGESRRPTLTWPREIPIDGEPRDVVETVERYAQWMSETDIPKLFVNAEPGSILTGSQREFCRTWPNQREVTVRGDHFLQEDSPNQIGEALADWLRTLA